jgi:hypothetical protein
MAAGDDARTIEPGAAAGLWRVTLSQIPSLFGKLWYLSSLRNPHTGRYEHYGLAARYGEEQAHQAILDSHAMTFSTWLARSVEEKKQDAELFLSGETGDRREVIRNWLISPPYARLAPAAARSSEIQLCELDFQSVLLVLAREHDLQVPDPEDR